MILALFFTRGVSLEKWVETGLFAREKLLYEAHLVNGNLKKVYWLTYGANDADLAEKLKSRGKLHPDIDILPMARFFRPRWGTLIYSFLIPLIHSKQLRKVSILKTNQMDGSWSAVIAKLLYKKPLIVRTGYDLTVFLQKQLKPRFSLKLAELVERVAYRFADIGITTSQQSAEYIFGKYGFSKERTEIIHNYINDELFHPEDCEKYENRIIFVGRLSEQKNLLNLFEAVAKTNLALDIYGGGKLRGELERWAKKVNASVNFKGIVPNSALPEILTRYRYYMLPSFYEGMPKTLLEAMACGLLCIGTDVVGINEVIDDGVNGILAAGTDVQSLVEILEKIVECDSEEIGSRAVEKIKRSFSLRSVAEREGELLLKTVSR
jgi:glycosyltransferase involved in cell wall biosynthesis